MKFYHSLTLSIALMLLPVAFLGAQRKPNIVLIFADNLGVGEVSSYGGVRGVPTPNIDRIGREGIRLTNFNVEYSCVPSRVALLTSRYAPRACTNYTAGMTLWETTIAEGMKSAGYATALFGKYDVGGTAWEGKREPGQQGFDQWYGIPGTSHVSQFTTFEGYDPKVEPVPFVWEGASGATSKKVKPFDVPARRTIDREAAKRGVAFMKENSKKGTPFFLYYPMTQLHFPTLAHPDQTGKTGAGDVGDAMADVDYNVGLILTALQQLGIEKNTIVIWCSDNGAELRRPWRGSPGPWRGYYNSAMEGGVRTPCVVRWPGRIPAGQVSNEMVHEIDLFPTLAAAAGMPSMIPTDRIIDGINQLPFLEGKQKRSNRESSIFMESQGRVMAVKWHDWKLWYDFRTELPDPEPDNQVRLFDLRADPAEEIDVKDYQPWAVGMMDKVVSDYEKSLETYPRVPADAADPYTPVPAAGIKVNVYSRTDRAALPARTPALEKPDFTGTWSTTVLQMRNVIGRVDAPTVPSLGSGWGNKISIIQRPDQLEVERVVFGPREIQPRVQYRYALNGSSSENSVSMGRTGKPTTSTSAWQENRLVITTMYPYQHPMSGEWLECKVTQTLWLQGATSTPWEPTLVVETYREAMVGGLPSTNRTVYVKGYR